MVCPNSINSSWLALRDVEGRLCWTDPKQRSVCGAETSETCEDRRTEVQTLVMLILVLEKSTTRWNPWRNQSGRTETVVSEQETAESLERDISFVKTEKVSCEAEAYFPDPDHKHHLNLRIDRTWIKKEEKTKTLFKMTLLPHESLSPEGISDIS